MKLVSFIDTHYMLHTKRLFLLIYFYSRINNKSDLIRETIMFKTIGYQKSFCYAAAAQYEISTIVISSSLLEIASRIKSEICRF